MMSIAGVVRYLKTLSRSGTVTLAGGVKTVAVASVTVSTRIFITVQSLGTVVSPVAVSVVSRVPGVSFTIKSADATDSSVVAWEMKEP